MDKATRIALEASIKHWENNTKALKPMDVRVGVSSCALCVAFHAFNCSGCPVRERTGRGSCSNTPYSVASQALRRWKRCSHAVEREARAGFTLAATEELNFLVGLRDA